MLKNILRIFVGLARAGNLCMRRRRRPLAGAVPAWHRAGLRRRHVGLMGVLADACLAQGGRVIGVIPQALVDKEVAHSGLTDYAW